MVDTIIDFLIEDCIYCRTVFLKQSLVLPRELTYYKDDAKSAHDACHYIGQNKSARIFHLGLVFFLLLREWPCFRKSLKMLAKYASNFPQDIQGCPGKGWCGSKTSLIIRRMIQTFVVTIISLPLTIQCYQELTVLFSIPCLNKQSYQLTVFFTVHMQQHMLVALRVTVICFFSSLFFL